MAGQLPATQFPVMTNTPQTTFRTWEFRQFPEWSCLGGEGGGQEPHQRLKTIPRGKLSGGRGREPSAAQNLDYS